MDTQQVIAAPARRGLPAAKLDQVVTFIEARLGDGLKLHELAATVRMSQFHFARKFRLSTGQSPHAYLTLRRMERAKHLLRETDMPLAQVAREVGYQTQAHFTGVFRRYVGLTPRTFRLQSRNAAAPVAAMVLPPAAAIAPASRERLADPVAQA
jgi:AraC family transcriptional regulator